MAKTQRIILGLVGHPGSGKTVAGRYLAGQYGFHHYESGDGLREYAQRKGALLFSPEDYHILHKRLQQELGDDVLAQMFLGRTEPRLVFVGVRALANAKAIQAAGGLIIALDCPIEQRFARIDHSSLKYHDSLPEFQKAEEDNIYSPDGYSTEIKQIMQVADFTLDTSQPIEATRESIDALITRLSEAANKK